MVVLLLIPAMLAIFLGVVGGCGGLLPLFKAYHLRNLAGTRLQEVIFYLISMLTVGSWGGWQAVICIGFITNDRSTFLPLFVLSAYVTAMDLVYWAWVVGLGFDLASWQLTVEKPHEMGLLACPALLAVATLLSLAGVGLSWATGQPVPRLPTTERAPPLNPEG